MTPFSIKLRSLRESRGTQQKSLATRLRVGASYLSALEQGKKAPPQNEAFYESLRNNLDLTDEELRQLKQCVAATEMLGPFAVEATPMQLEMLLKLATGLKQLQPTQVRAINAILSPD
ncbi:XRE family transcriptional regulator [Oxalobacteraceae bacterium OM1]|nr:XRE family transcriptional regulator [Oxalobacteraceae bacterium OM1]